MLGEKISETAGKVTTQRVLPGDASGAKIEVSFQTTGKLLGIEINEIGTYSSVMKPGGSLYGEGQGVLMTKDGDSCVWRGAGAGKPTGLGMGASYRGCIYFETQSPKFSKLNSMCGVFEYEVDQHGNTRAIVSEWK